MPSDDLAAHLRRILRAPSPFYRQRLLAAGASEAEPLDAAVLARLPLTRRAELLRDQLDHLPFGTRRFADAQPPVRLGVTGGGDDLLVLAWSGPELARERAAGIRLLGRLGVRAGMRVANALPGALATPGSLLLGDVVEELGSLDVPLGAVEGEAAARQAWELADRVEPEVIVLDEPSGRAFLSSAPARERPWWRGIVWLRCGPPAPPAVPAAAGFSGWRRSWLAVPEATSFVAGTCAASRFHVEEGVLAEVVDEATGAVRHEGVLALTPVGGETQLLRYATGLRVRAVERCGCGERGAALELL